MKLNVKAFGATCGLFWGLALFFLTWWAIIVTGATQEMTFIGRIYVGYSITPLGSVIGLAWGLIDGAIAGLIFAWLYNLINAKMPTKA